MLKIHKAVKNDPEISSRKLAKVSGVAHNTANRYKKEMRQWLTDFGLDHPLVIGGPCSAE